tara:strand:- start:3723 stop:5213 length:1491 start_codon:yes stop_codon:yes gene_type:complete
MGIQRYSASIDTTIANAFKMDLTTRATGSNMGLADTLETFSIYGQASSASSELSRILIQFPVSDISADRTAGTIPASGSVNFFLRMYNAEHPFTLPKNFDLNILAVSRSWEEGYGLDMDEYTDLTYDDIGSNWINAASGSNNWTTAGGDYYTDTSSSFTASFVDGTEDIELDITTLVEQWVNSAGNVLGSKTNYGLGIKFFDAEETAVRSYYTKKFFARDSEFFLKRPTIEARWDSSTKDNQGSFFLSSSLATATENLNTIYIYNNIRGQLRNIPGVDTGTVLVSIYSGSANNTSPLGSKLLLPVGGGVVATGDTNITGGYVSTGVYSASFAYASSSITTIFPVWHDGTTEYNTGSAIEVNTFDSADFNPHPSYVSNVTNLKDSYTRDEKTTRFRLYVREKDWNPNIYTKASSDIATSIIEDAYYRIYRTIDEFEVVAYGTGSTNHTRLSYDASGSYFDFPMDILEAGYMYAFRFTYRMPDGNYREQPEIFKFRVE